MKSFQYILNGTFAVIVSLTTMQRACTPPKAMQQRAIPYPKPLPDTTAIPFLPPYVSSDSSDFGAAFSPDRQSFYFARSINKQTTIFVSHFIGNTWMPPVPFPFIETSYSEADPAFAPDGKLYFISDRPKDPSDTIRDFDIWSITPLGNGEWSEPENVQRLNSDSNEYYISFAHNGNCYFSSNRTGGFGEEDIYVSNWRKKQYDEPKNLGPAINTKRSEYDPGISLLEEMIVFTSSNREDSFGGADLYASTPDAKKQWRPAINLGIGFNTKSREFCPYFTPDGKYFFFSSERDIKWISNDYVKKRIDVLW